MFDVERFRCLWWEGAVENVCEGLVLYVEVPWEGVRNDIFYSFDELWV